MCAQIMNASSEKQDYDKVCPIKSCSRAHRCLLTQPLVIAFIAVPFILFYADIEKKPHENFRKSTNVQLSQNYCRLNSKLIFFRKSVTFL